MLSALRICGRLFRCIKADVKVQFVRPIPAFGLVVVEEHTDGLLAAWYTNAGVGVNGFTK